MGNLIWHEWARYVSLTATVCKLSSAHRSQEWMTDTATIQTLYGQPSGEYCTVNSSGTSLVALCVRPVVSSTYLCLTLVYNCLIPDVWQTGQ